MQTAAAALLTAATVPFVSREYKISLTTNHTAYAIMRGSYGHISAATLA